MKAVSPSTLFNADEVREMRRMRLQVAAEEGERTAEQSDRGEKVFVGDVVSSWREIEIWMCGTAVGCTFSFA